MVQKLMKFLRAPRYCGRGTIDFCCLCRYLVQDSVSVLVKGKWKKWEIIDKAIEQEGWKLLVLLRLSPIVPYNLLNITMAATKIHFWPFALASFFGRHSSLLLPKVLWLSSYSPALINLQCPFPKLSR